MKQFRVLSLLTLFCLLIVGSFGISMMAYQQSYQNFSQIASNGLPNGSQEKLSPSQQKEYVAELNAIYLRNQFI